MRPRIYAALLLACACAPDIPEPGRSDVIPLHFPPDRGPAPDTLDYIADVFGMEVLLRDEGFGAIVVYLYDEPTATAAGYSPGGEFCAASVSSVRVPMIVAHEVGHALGLGHVDEPGNLMNIVDTGATLTDEQIDTARTYAWFHDECRREGRQPWWREGSP